MKRIFKFLVAFCLASPLHADDRGALTLKSTIALPGVEGRFDHAAVDVATHRLFFAALGNNTLEVVDINAGKRLHSIVGLKKPTGVLFLANENLLIVANGDDGTCRFYNGTSYAERGRVTGVDDADNLRLDAKTKRVYLGYGEGALGVIDPAAMKLNASIALSKHPEAFQLEENGPRIFVNVPDSKQIVVVDREQRPVVATWPLEKWQANFPMALDKASDQLFVGCRKPARLVIFDTKRGAPVADLEISGDTDDLFFDAKRERLYASCGEGFLDVIQRRDGDRYERVSRIVTRAGARTCFFSPELDRLFLAVPERNGQHAELRVYQPE